jgi:hypothetical protein
MSGQGLPSSSSVSYPFQRLYFLWEMREGLPSRGDHWTAKNEEREREAFQNRSKEMHQMWDVFREL